MNFNKKQAKHAQADRLKKLEEQLEKGEAITLDEIEGVDSGADAVHSAVSGETEAFSTTDALGALDAGKTEALGSNRAAGQKQGANGITLPSIDAEAGGSEETVALPSVGSSSAGAAAPLQDETAVLPSPGEQTPQVDDDALAGFDVDAAGYPLDLEHTDGGSYVAADFSNMPVKRKRRALKVFGIAIGVILACLLGAYIGGAVVFMNRFLPNTYIIDSDVSMKTDEEVAQMLDDYVSSYDVDVKGGGFTYQATSDDLGMAIDSESIVEAMHNDLDSWKWPLLLIEGEHDESRHFVVTYKRADCEAAVGKKVKQFNKDAKAPVNATIVYNGETGEYDIKPEEVGTQLNAKKVKAAVTEAIANMQPVVTLGEDELKKPKIYSTDEKLIESAKLATGMVSAHVTLNLNGQNVGEVDGEELSQYVTIDDKTLDVTFKEDEMQSWVKEMSLAFDTIGTERSYTRDDGKQVTVKGGSYGWEVDSAAMNDALLEAIKKGETTEIEIPCISTAGVYTGPNERDWGNRYIDVDISEQHAVFYGDNGKVIWEADFISGAPDGKRNTWEGVWYVNNKESPSTLIGYTDTGKKEYETKVQYWMPFEGNGIGFHDATWQPGFGGSMYQDGYGSHGCVNLSASDAEELYGLVEVGDVVVVHS